MLSKLDYLERPSLTLRLFFPAVWVPLKPLPAAGRPLAAPIPKGLPFMSILPLLHISQVTSEGEQQVEELIRILAPEDMR